MRLKGQNGDAQKMTSSQNLIVQPANDRNREGPPQDI